MERLKVSGIDTIFFRVFQNRGDTFFHVLPIQANVGVYFKTPYAPLVSDLLPLVCRKAHAHGITVYAWMSTLSAAFLPCSSRVRHVYKYDLASDKVIKTGRLSPFDSVVKACLSGLFSDLAKNPIDGILIQDDLILHYNEDLSPYAIHLYEREAHVSEISPQTLYKVSRGSAHTFRLHGFTDTFWRWSRWKSMKLAYVLKDLMQTVKKVKPGIKIALNVNYESLLMPRDALAWYSREIPTLEKIAHPDQYMVMSYQEQMARELKKPYSVILEDLGRMAKEAITLIPEPSRWIFKVQTIDWKTRHPVTMERIMRAVSSIDSVSSVQTCLMPYAPFLLVGDGKAKRQPRREWISEKGLSPGQTSRN